MTALAVLAMVLAADPKPEPIQPTADGMRLDVRYGMRSAVVYFAGADKSAIGVFSGKTQFSLDAEGGKAITTAFEKFKVAEMPASFGGMPRPKGGPDIGAPEILVGGVSLTKDGKPVKSVQQLGGGVQSKELADFCAAVLDVCEASAKKNGVTAKDIADGLKKVGTGELHPATLSILVHRLPEKPTDADQTGFLFRLEGGAVLTRERGPKGYGPVYKLVLKKDELVAVTKLLTDNEVGGFPVNLWAPTYTDLVVRVLNHEKNMQARQFANTTPKTHGKKQEQFDAVYAGLLKLHQRALKDGTKLPGEP
ncbi:MAG: hypothetical protein L0241_12915 [Planctomycetia bacterium]|nr:hypothetical protein [Planctomycetia bacterium]